MRVINAGDRFAELVTRYNQGEVGVVKDFRRAAHDIRNQLEDAKEEVDVMRPPASPQGKAFHDAYLELLKNQIKYWENEGLELVRILEDEQRTSAEIARDFNPLLQRLKEMEQADLNKVKGAQLEFLKAYNIPPK
jgi:hypothetical protein